MDQLGGADAMAAAVDRKTWWAYTVSDEDAAANARTNLSFADACTLAFTIPGDPRGKGRPRATTIGGQLSRHAARGPRHSCN